MSHCVWWFNKQAVKCSNLVEALKRAFCVDSSWQAHNSNWGRKNNVATIPPIEWSWTLVSFEIIVLCIFMLVKRFAKCFVIHSSERGPLQAYHRCAIVYGYIWLNTHTCTASSELFLLQQINMFATPIAVVLLFFRCFSFHAQWKR